MSELVLVAAHPRAGRVEATRLAVRSAEPTARGPDDALAPISAETALRAGAQRMGALEVDVHIRGGGGEAELELGLRNVGAAPLAVDALVVGLRWLDHGVRSLRFLRQGWASGSPCGGRSLEPRAGAPASDADRTAPSMPADRAGWCESHLATAVGASPRGATCALGVLERGESFGAIYLRAEPEAVAIEVELRLEAVLEPGARRELEPIRVALGQDASRLLEEHAEAHGRACAARAHRPFVAGWCGWSHLLRDPSEQDLLRTLDALVDSRDDLDVEVVQIGAGYQRAVGDWTESNERFPRGLAGLAEAIRAAGFAPGLWTAPFCVSERSRAFSAQRDRLLACAGEPLRVAQLDPEPIRVLDPSAPEVARHIEQLYRALVEMGFSHLELGLLRAVARRCTSSDAATGPAGRLRRGLEAVRAGAGAEAFLLAAECPLGPAVGWVDGMRVGPDVVQAWRESGAAQSAALAPPRGVRVAVENAVARAWMHRRLWLNDPGRLDFEGLSAAESRTLAAALATTGGVLLGCGDAAARGAERHELARDALSLARRLDGLGIPARMRATDPLGDGSARGVAVAWAAADVTSLINAGDEPSERFLTADAGADGQERALPEPMLGSRKPSAAGAARLSVELAPRESAVFLLRRRFPLAVFCDFDGTFSVQDVGSTLAERHAAERRPAQWARYQRGEITAWEYNIEILDGLELPLASLEEFLRSVDLDPGARALVAWCEQHNVPFRILSDGFDYNLNRLQILHGVRFAYDANRLRYERGRWRIAAAHPSPTCPCGTGTCKRSRIEAFRARYPGVPVVHVGNGRVSDLCGALAADLAFAKDTLAEELRRRGVEFEPFASLNDVIEKLERRLESGIGSD